MGCGVLLGAAHAGVAFVPRQDAAAQSGDGVTEEWVRRYSGLGDHNDYATAIAVDGAGNAYVTGSSADDYATIKYGPDGSEQWVRRYNGPADRSDRGQGIALDGTGNVYVTGDSLEVYDSGHYSPDYATVKYSSDGSEQWVRRYSGPGNYDDFTTIAVDGAGNAYVTGRSYDSASNYDYATIKYGTDGTEQWVRRYNGPGNGDDYATAIAVDGAGNVYVTGISDNSSQRPDYATIKYGPDGSEQWVRRYNGPANDDDYARGLAVDGTGNVYVTGGSADSDVGKPLDYATVKYASDGSEQWVRRYNGPGNWADSASSVAVDGAGNVYVTGGSSSYSWGGASYTTIKYGPDGSEQWVRRDIDGAARAIALDVAGNVYVTGWSSTPGTWYDYGTIKYGPDGSLLWVRLYNGPDNWDDEATSIAVDDTGNVYVTGSSEDSSQHRDYATIKYSQGPTRRVVLFIKGTPSKANCTIDGWSGIRDTLKTGLGMTDSDFLEYDYTSVDDTPQGCGPDDEYAEYETPPDSCWSLDEADSAASCDPGKPGQGERLAGYLNTYLRDNPGVSLSIVGHSQGGLLAVYTLREFASQYPSLSRIGPVVTLDSPLKGINIFSPKVFRTRWQGCGSLDYCYDSAYDMHPVSEVVILVKSDNPGRWPRVFTVDETGKDGTCPACIEVVDSKHSTVGWAADRFSVFTGNHGNTIWNWDGTGDPIGVPMLKRFVACAIGGLRPADTCHDYADDLPLNIDLYETVRQPYLLQDNNQLFSIRLDKGDLDLQAPQAQYAFAAAEAMTPTVTMRLISPSDRIIDAGTSAADVTHSSGDSFEQFDIADPEAGEWTVELYGADVPPDGADVYLSMVAVPDASVDQDGDGVRDSEDNCPDAWNATQSDADQDGIGDVCDADDDNDGVADTADNCEFAPNPDQADVNQNGFGDACDPDLWDLDGDSILDGVDNCPFDPNPDQADINGNGIGDVCEEAAAPVGGIAELPDVVGPARATAESSRGSSTPYAAIAGAAAAGLVVLGAGGWYARRRRPGRR